MQDLYRDFLDETADSVALLERELRALAVRPDDAGLLAAIFRHVHNIKGTCGFLGLQTLEDAAHEMEGALSRLRAGAGSPELPGLLRATCTMRRIVAQLALEAGDGSADIWAHLPRLVDDLSRRLGKLVDLRVSGDVAALDGRLLLAARDSLIHLIRNAIDHGIEPPCDRRRAGKPERGLLELDIRRIGGDVVVTIADDGRGLDLVALRERVLAHGLAQPADLAAVPDADLGRHIFAPGISTAGRVTVLSGRGVGLDSVQAAMTALGGAVHVASEPGRGARFVMRLPAGAAGVPARRAAV